MTSSVRRFSPFESRPVRASLWIGGAIMAAALGLGLWCSAARPLTITSNRTQEPKFTYAGGTEDVLAGCPGTLQLTSDSMTYSCAQRSVAIPYRAIETMQYRADVIRHVRKLRLKWRVVPPIGGGHNNRYFTLVYRVSGVTHVMVFQVPEDEMRPYLAEIDLKCGRRVDVQRHEDYE